MEAGKLHLQPSAAWHRGGTETRWNCNKTQMAGGAAVTEVRGKTRAEEGSSAITADAQQEPLPSIMLRGMSHFLLATHSVLPAQPTKSSFHCSFLPPTSPNPHGKPAQMSERSRPRVQGRIGALPFHHEPTSAYDPLSARRVLARYLLPGRSQRARSSQGMSCASESDRLLPRGAVAPQKETLRGSLLLAAAPLTYPPIPSPSRPRPLAYFALSRPFPGVVLVGRWRV